MRCFSLKCVATGLLAALLALPTATASAGEPSLAQSNAFGKTLAQWMTLYWEWSLGNGPDQVGNVVFLPLPAGEHVSGDFTFGDPGVLVGEAEVTLRPGNAFALPVITWIGESYLPELNLPDDLPLDSSVFTVADVSLDGQSIMNSTDLSEYYYGAAYFDSPVEYSEPTNYGANAAVFVQGIGLVHGPLSKGMHTLTLVSAIQIPEYNLGLKFVNTWTIVVEK